MVREGHQLSQTIWTGGQYIILYYATVASELVLPPEHPARCSSCPRESCAFLSSGKRPFGTIHLAWTMHQLLALLAFLCCSAFWLLLHAFPFNTPSWSLAQARLCRGHPDTITCAAHSNIKWVYSFTWKWTLHGQGSKQPSLSRLLSTWLEYQKWAWLEGNCLAPSIVTFFYHH